MNVLPGDSGQELDPFAIGVPLELLEWESFIPTLTVSEFQAPTDLPGDASIAVSRDESYKLALTLTGTGPIPDVDPPGPVGSFNDGVTIRGVNDPHRFSVTIDGALRTGRVTKSGTGPYTAELYAARVSLCTGVRAPCTWLAHWYLNGPRDVVFHRVTERITQLAHRRSRVHLDGLPDGAWAGQVTQEFSGGGDYILVRPDDSPAYLLAKVPEGHGPSWSVNVAIEFHENWGGIPDEPHRRAVGELVSFVLGRHLLHIGSSTYDAGGMPIEVVAEQPWGRDIRTTCESLDYSPLTADRRDVRRGHMFETVLRELTPRYLQLRGPLALDEALWRYWIARRAPIGTSLPIYAAALETVKNAWFSGEASKTKGKYVDKAEFDKIIAPGLELVREQLLARPYGDRMIRKISSAFQMSINEQIPQFFEEIGLPVGKGEQEVLRARNAVVHGGQSGKDITRNVTLSHAYATMFHRVFLKLLHYSGPYADRSVLGWPQRELNEPIGLEV